MNTPQSILDEHYVELSHNWLLWEEPLYDALNNIVESLSQILNAKRISIWVGNKNQTGIKLLSMFIQGEKREFEQYELLFSAFPNYFRTLNENRIIDISDVYTDERTREFPEEYLKSMDVGSVLQATLNKTGKLSGVLCIEHLIDKRDWSEPEKRFVISIADLIAQRLVHEDIRREEARYRTLFEGAGDSIFLMNSDMFVDCNEATTIMFECTKDQMVGHSPIDFSPEYQPDGRSSKESALEKINAAIDGKTQFFEWEHLKCDGTPFDAAVTLNAVEIEGEQQILATVRDISGSKRSEQELGESKTQLLAQNENLKLINELSNKLHSSISVEHIIEETLNTLLGLTRTPHVAIFLLNETQTALELVSSHGFDENILKAGSTIPLQNSLSGLAIDKGEILYSSDFASDGRLNERIKQALLAGEIDSGVVVPLIYQGTPLGSLNLVYKGHKTFTDSELETLQTIGKTMSMSIDNSKKISDLKYMAHHDPLTGLSNRSVLHNVFRNEVINAGCDSAVLFLFDLDRFKEINDTFGHHTGDKILKLIGPRLEVCAEGYKSVVSRLGGDEFTVMIHCAPGKDKILKIAEDFLENIRKPFVIDSMDLEIDASIGISLYPEHGQDSHELLRFADVAMYEAKHKGGGINFYDKTKDLNSPERLALTANLSSAVRKGEMVLHYQPKVDLSNGNVTGFEALVRWQHPELGLLYPDEFIPLAEVTDAIHHLTENVLLMALDQQVKWREAGHDYSVAVNLSARNLMSERCIGRLKDMLLKYDIKPGKLELEITETALMHDPDKAVSLLNQIHDLGISLSIDDFGTGYSSLYYLRQLPIDSLKIDRVFVKDMLRNNQDAIIVRSTIGLAHNLNLNVIAEGVEDEETLQSLRMMTCDLIQGYHISRPKAWDEIEKWLNDL